MIIPGKHIASVMSIHLIEHSAGFSPSNGAWMLPSIRKLSMLRWLNISVQFWPFFTGHVIFRPGHFIMANGMLVIFG